MKEKHKSMYATPTTEVLEVSMKRVLCASGPLLIMLTDQPATPPEESSFGDTWTWE